MNLDKIMKKHYSLTTNQKQAIALKALSRAFRTGNKVAIAIRYAVEFGLMPPPIR